VRHPAAQQVVGGDWGRDDDAVGRREAAILESPDPTHSRRGDAPEPRRQLDRRQPVHLEQRRVAALPEQDRRRAPGIAEVAELERRLELVDQRAEPPSERARAREYAALLRLEANGLYRTLPLAQRQARRGQRVEQAAAKAIEQRAGEPLDVNTGALTRGDRVESGVQGPMHGPILRRNGAAERPPRSRTLPAPWPPPPARGS
jgi:hypothetical protein